MVLRYEQQRNSETEDERIRAFEKTLGRWADQMALAAWNKWLESMPSGDHKKGAGLMRYCVQRVLDRTRFNGWKKWKEVFAAETRAARTMKRCLDRLAHQETSRGWNQWLTFIIAARQRDSLMASMTDETLHVVQQIEARLRAESEAQILELRKELEVANTTIRELRMRKSKRPPPAPTRTEHHAMKILNKWKDKVSQQQQQHQEEVLELRRHLNSSFASEQLYTSRSAARPGATPRSADRFVNRSNPY